MNSRKSFSTRTAEEKYDDKEFIEIAMKEENRLEDLTESIKKCTTKVPYATVNDKQANNKTTDKSLKADIQYECENERENSFTDCCEHDIDREITISSYDTLCGIFNFRPQWLQPYASVKVYTILYSILGIIHGSYYSYLVGTLSTLEKRYAFKSKTSSIIFIADEMAPLFLGILIGYYSGKANRPRIIALGMLLSALCSFLSSFPYFIFGSVKHLTIQSAQNTRGPEFCNPDSNAESCNLHDQPPSLSALLFLIFGSFLKGFSNLAYYTIGIIYLDDNSQKTNTPLYLGITLSLRWLGPFVGYLMSFMFLKLYEDPLEDPGYGPEDPRWVGAWWIGYFLQGVFLTILTIPISLFPKRLPGQKTIKNTAPLSSQNNWKEIFQDLVASVKRIGKNPVFVLVIIYTVLSIFSVHGHSMMLPKYMENRFRLSASEASLYSGAVSIVFIMMSTVSGGYLIWKFKPRIKVLLAGMITSEIICSIGFLCLIIPQCPPADMMNFGTNDEGLILENFCSQQCHCSKTSFTPYCGQDGKTYFSPCYAGCTQETNSSKTQKEFRYCSCLAPHEDTQFESIISEGLCPDDNCWSQALAYLIIFLILESIRHCFQVVHTIILLRSVHPNDKSVAYGTFESFISLLGYTLCPIIMGNLVDTACLVWQENCSETGHCWIYDMDRFSYLVHGVSATFCLLTALCHLVLYYQSHRIRDLYEDDEKEYMLLNFIDTASESSDRS